MSPRVFREAIILAVVPMLGLGLWLFLGVREYGALGSESEDLPMYFWAMRGWLGRALSQGVVPWWVSQIYGGMPFLANPQVAGFYPPNWLFAVLPIDLAFNATSLGHLWWWGFGTGVLARRLRLSLLASLLAGLVAVLSGPALGRVYAGHVTMVAAASWMPWALWLSGRLWAGGPFPGGSVAALGLVIGLALLAGLPQVFVYGAVIVVLWNCCGVAFACRLRGRGHAARCVFRPACALCFGLALSAVQWLPTLHYLEHAARQFVTAEYRATYSLPPVNLCELVYPGWFGTTRDSWWGAWLPWEMAVFCGIPALVLAGAGVVCGVMLFGWRRRGLVLVLAGLALFCVLFSLGPITPVFRLLSVLPGFENFRAPVRMLVWLPLFVGLLAGIGLDGIRRFSLRDGFGRAGNLRISLVVLSGFAATLAAAFGVYFAGTLAVHEVAEIVTRRHPWSDNVGAVKRLSDLNFAVGVSRLATDSAVRSAVVAGLVVGLVLAVLAMPRRMRAIPLVCLLVLQGTHTAYELRHFAATCRPVTYNFSGAPPEHASRILLPHDAAQPNMFVGTVHGSPTGYDPLYPRRLGELVNAANGRRMAENPGALHIPTPLRLSSVVGITHVLAPRGGVVELPPGYGGPRATLHSGAVWASTRSEAFEILARRWGRLGHDAMDTGPPVLEMLAKGDGGGQPVSFAVKDGAAPDKDPKSVSVALSASPRHPSRLIVTLDPPSTGILVLRDSCLPGWTARVDGKSAPVHPANLAYRGVVLDTPASRVEMTYHAPGSGLGLGLTLASLLAAVLWGLGRTQKLIFRGGRAPVNPRSPVQPL